MYYIVPSFTHTFESSNKAEHDLRTIRKKKFYKPNHIEEEFHHKDYLLHHLCFRSLNRNTNFDSTKQQQDTIYKDLRTGRRCDTGLKRKSYKNI